MNKMMNKKGEESTMLAREGIGAIIVVIGLLILIALTVFLYSAIDGTKKARQAEGELSEIMSKFQELENKEEIEYIYLAPKGYYFYSNSKGESIGNCFSEYCLCLCDKPTCTGDNICVKSEKLVLVGNIIGIKLNPPVNLLMGRVNEAYYIMENK